MWSQGSLRCRDLGVWLRRESECLNISSEYLRRYLPSSTTIHPHAPPSVCMRISCNPSCAKVTALQSIAGRILNVSFSYSFFPFPSSSASTVYDSITLHDHASHFQPDSLFRYRIAPPFVILLEHCGPVVVAALPHARDVVVPDHVYAPGSAIATR